MPNMSHCRFQNTLKDILDCEEALGNFRGLYDLNNELSADEAKAAKKLIMACARVAADWAETLETA